MTDTQNWPISGYCSADFASVRRAFEDNFKRGEEIGAGFCLIQDGQIKIDLIGGYADRKHTRLWTDDTLVPVFSSTKLVTAAVIAHLCDQDKIGYNQKVASIWPEFAQNGKGEITVGQIMSHQAGLCGITDPGFTNADWFNTERLEAALAAQAPLFPPGSVSGYHPVTYGPLASAIARRADGRTLGEILREDICEPRRIDFHIGTPASEHHRCADLRKPDAMANFGEINAATKAAFFSKTSAPVGETLAQWREAEFGGSNGHGTAKALAEIANILVDGTIGGYRYLAEDMLEAFRLPRISGQNLVLPFELTFAAGVMLNAPNYFYGTSPDALGHSGWGGSCVFADPENGITGAYVMNRQSESLLGDSRPLRLIGAAYDCL